MCNMSYDQLTNKERKLFWTIASKLYKKPSNKTTHFNFAKYINETVKHNIKKKKKFIQRAIITGLEIANLPY